jgi:prepilin-type N-terminal cleavage/methylation domain-containing protein
MLRTPNKRRGFTITEILIAVLLVLILSAIAVPRLLGNQRQADDANAKAQLRTSAEVARNLMYEAGNSFHTATHTKMGTDEPNIKFTDQKSVVDGRTRSVSVKPSGSSSPAGTWVAAALGGESGSLTNCWYIKLDTRGKDSYGLRQLATGEECIATTQPTWDNTLYDFPSAP